MVNVLCLYAAFTVHFLFNHYHIYAHRLQIALKSQ